MPLGVFYLFLASVGLAWNPYICQTDTVGAVKGLSGYDIVVTDTNCDAVAKWERMRVHISHAGKNEHDVIFEYSPMENPWIPTFSTNAAGNLLISISAVATVFRQERVWRGINIAYNIGKEYYPDPKPQPGKR